MMQRVLLFTNLHIGFLYMSLNIMFAVAFLLLVVLMKTGWLCFPSQDLVVAILLIRLICFLVPNLLCVMLLYIMGKNMNISCLSLLL